MEHTFGKMLDMGRLIARPAIQTDSDGDNESMGDYVPDLAHERLSVYRRTMNVVVSDRIDSGERPLRPRTDAEERQQIAADGHERNWERIA